MKIPFQVVFMRVSVGIAGADEVLRVIHAGVCLHPTVWNRYTRGSHRPVRRKP